MALLLAAGIGAAAFISFLVFLYSGPQHVVHVPLGEPGILLFDALLSAAFFLQHSSMIRRRFRSRVLGAVPPHRQGALFAVSSGIVLLAVVVLWQESDTVLLAAHGAVRYLMRGIYFASLLGICWGMWSLRSFDMFGLVPIVKKMQDKPCVASPFTIRGPYRWVRHPLYLFMIVLVWSHPVLTTDRLLFNLLWTGWIVVGTVLEERDLTADFGEAYRAYRAEAPMLLPRRLRPLRPAPPQ